MPVDNSHVASPSDLIKSDHWNAIIDNLIRGPIHLDSRSSLADPIGDHQLYMGADANHPWIGSKSNHDLRIMTNSTERMRITAGGDVEIWQQGSLSFGNQTRQMLNLWTEEYGIGVQSSTLYFRSDDDFAFFKQGTHDDGSGNPGTGGTRLMAINGAGDLVLSARTNPDNDPAKPRCRALVDYDEQLVINFAGDFSKGVLIPNQSNLNFGNQTRQMLNLWQDRYGIGVQNLGLYFRSDDDFAFYKQGTHDNGSGNPGTGGTRLMAINGSGDLILSARTNPDNDPAKPQCRALVDYNEQLVINYAGDFSKGVLIPNQSNLNFGNQTRQMLNLWQDRYGIGVQSSTLYFRTDAHFAWHIQGSHTNNERDPGGGEVGMVLYQNGDFWIKNRLFVNVVDPGNGPSIELAGSGRFVRDTSSRRTKQNISSLNVDFKKVLQLTPRIYNRHSAIDKKEIGYIAEEAESLGLTALLFFDEEGRPNGFNYKKLSMYLLEIVREHERLLNPDSSYLEQYMEEEVPKPTKSSTKAEITRYFDYLRVPYTKKETKDELLEKLNSLNEPMKTKPGPMN